MGAEVEVGKGVSSITGPTPLTGTTVTATDLRCGASLVIAGLMAEGTTIIKDAYHIYRGYDNIKEKLKSLGADVE
jgi:UDP-N-acetylglucosamine 1-carboxyvinyltransferase